MFDCTVTSLASELGDWLKLEMGDGEQQGECVFLCVYLEGYPLVEAAGGLMGNGETV